MTGGDLSLHSRVQLSKLSLHQSPVGLNDPVNQVAFGLKVIRWHLFYTIFGKLCEKQIAC